MESVNTKEPTENVDRVVLRRSERDKLERWLEGLNERFDGMLKVTKSDLANFLIRQHAADLSGDEIALIEAEFFDEVRWLGWALAKIRKSKREGLALSLEVLMAKRNQVGLTKVAKLKRKKKSPEAREPAKILDEIKAPETNPNS